MIDANALPTPSKVEAEQQNAVVQSSAWRSGSILQSRDVDPTNRPRIWTLIFERVNGATGSAIRQHFAAHCLRDFSWTPPGESTARRVIHREPPTLDWESSTTLSARVYLEEVLAHD